MPMEFITLTMLAITTIYFAPIKLSDFGRKRGCDMARAFYVIEYLDHGAWKFGRTFSTIRAARIHAKWMAAEYQVRITRVMDHLQRRF